MSSPTTYAAACRPSGPPAFPWPPAARAPQPLPDGNYVKTLFFVPPQVPDLRFIRKDSWGVPVYDAHGTPLPFVPDGSSVHPERCLTGFFNRWNPTFGVDPKWQPLILDTQAALGLTHFELWLPDALYGARSISFADYVTQCQMIRARGFFVSHWLGSKNFPQHLPADADAATWQRVLDPLLDALVAADCAQHVVMGGEYDLWNDPAQTLNIAAYLTKKMQPSGGLVYLHLSTWKTWWGLGDRFTFTTDMCNLGVRGLRFQLDSDADIPTCQARVNDTLGHPGIDPRWDVVIDELVASAEFDGDHPTMAEASVKGFAVNCAPSGVPGWHTWGYGNNGCQPSGIFL